MRLGPHGSMWLAILGAWSPTYRVPEALQHGAALGERLLNCRPLGLHDHCVDLPVRHHGQAIAQPCSCRIFQNGSRSRDIAPACNLPPDE